MTIIDDDAAKIHRLGWQQGSIFQPHSINLVLPNEFSFDSDMERLVICSQSCSVVSPRFKADPNVEAIAARLIADINLSFA